MDKLNMHSPNLVEQNIEKLAALFPNCVTEAKDAHGRLQRAIDFDLLKQELSRHIVEGSQERYQLNWPGKREALLAANAPIAKTLRPCREESVNFDTTQNLFIEGDNLDALKLLQETYLGKVKMIYIDPPYNTGNDFIYEDDFAEDVESYITRSNQKDAEGNRLVANTESNGRFHSDWLSMMYPRLKLARNLLKEDGVIFISIDDSEIENLKSILNELFGLANFIATLIWEKGRKNDAKLVSAGHEYMLIFAKNKSFLREKDIKWREVKPGAQEVLDEYIKLRDLFGNDNQSVENGIKSFYETLPKNHPSKKHSRYNKVDGKGVWRDDNISWPGGGGPTYDVIHPETKLPCLVPEGGWRYSTIEKMNEMIECGKVIFRKNHIESPIKKTYLVEIAEDDGIYDNSDIDSEDLPIQVAGSYFYRSALQASNELSEMFGGRIFNNPKDREVIERWISYVGVSSGDIVMDFFAGSGTTGHSVLSLNAAQGKSIRYILVQLPEVINPKMKGAKPAISFLNGIGSPHFISEISKERIRRAGQKIVAGEHHTEWNQDIGFRVLKIDSSNMADIYYTPDTTAQHDLFAQVENVKPDRTEEDLLFQVMLDWGVDLTLPITRQTFNGKTVFFVEPQPDHCHAVLAACFDNTGAVDEGFIQQLAALNPLRLVFRDAGFASDAAKINAAQLLKQLSPNTDMKTL